MASLQGFTISVTYVSYKVRSQTRLLITTKAFSFIELAIHGGNQKEGFRVSADNEPMWYANS